MAEILITERLIHLRNERVSYIIYLLEGGVPMHLYFGARVEAMNPATFLRKYELAADGSFSLQGCALDHTPQEYPSFGLGEMREGALTVRRADGTRRADLRFVSAAIEDGKPGLPGLPATFGDGCKTLRLTLRDALLNLEATLLYTVFDDCDAIARSVSFRNAGEDALCLERAYSLCLDMPDSRYDLLTLSGRLEPGAGVDPPSVDPRRAGGGQRAGRVQLADLALPGAAAPGDDRGAGRAYGAALVYSGNFYAGVQVDSHRCAASCWA